MLALFVAGYIVPKSRVTEEHARVEEMKEERDEWRRAAELQAARADSAIQTGRIVRDVMGALKEGAEMSHAVPPPTQKES